MKFKTGRVINRLALPITRECNRRCPECPARSDEDFAEVSPSELKWIGDCIGPIGKVEVTGGEPSLHPHFDWIAENIHKIFDCKDIMVLTNAMVPEEKYRLFDYFDRVYITHYTDKFSETYGTSNNTEEVNRLSEYLGGKKPVWVQKMDCHVPKSWEMPWADRCIFGYDSGDMVSYYRGKLYGCCTSWQLHNRGKGIVLSKGWRDELKDMELPCNRCFLGVAEQK